MALHPSRAAYFVCALALALGWTTSARSTTLALVDPTSSVNCGRGTVLGSSCSEAILHGIAGVNMAIAEASYTGGKKPKVFVSAFATSNADPATGFAQPVLATAGSTLVYQYSLDEDRSTPLGGALTVVPIRVRSRADGTLDSLGPAPSSSWFAQLTLSRPGSVFPTFQINAGTFASSPTFDVDFPLLLVPGEAWEVSIRASCTASAPGVTLADTSAACSAFTDPELVLDQAAFDATWGASSFLLEDYFSFSFSPGLVPEPGVGWLLGCAALAALRRRRAGALGRRPRERIGSPRPTTSS